jgi:hypothetical protein
MMRKRVARGPLQRLVIVYPSLWSRVRPSDKGVNQ